MVRAGPKYCSLNVQNLEHRTGCALKDLEFSTVAVSRKLPGIYVHVYNLLSPSLLTKILNTLLFKHFSSFYCFTQRNSYVKKIQLFGFDGTRYLTQN